MQYFSFIKRERSDCTAGRAQLSVECGFGAQFHVRRVAVYMDYEAMLQRDCCTLEKAYLDVCLACVGVGSRFSVVE